MDVVGKKHDRRVPYNVVYLTGAESRKAPVKESVDACSHYMFEKLVEARRHFEMSPLTNHDRNHVLVPMGKAAMQALLPKVRKLGDVRGKRVEREFGGYTWQICPTFSRTQLSMTQGYARVMSHDLTKAWRLSLSTSVEAPQDVRALTEDYTIPQTIEEVEEICDHVLGLITNGDVKTISLDIETNTKDPYRTDAHTSVLSFSWGPGLSTAILLDHPRTHYDAERAWAAVTPILESDAQKVFHNGKFDLQFLRNIRGLKVPNLWWDTILAEHFLDEDKKGVYGLKEVIGLYAPKYVGYEEELRANFVKQSIEGVRGDAGFALAPDPEREWDIMSFFADLEYTPISTQDTPGAGLDWDDHEFDPSLRSDLFDMEVRYLLAHRNGEKKAKTNGRGRIRRLCIKNLIEPPATVKNRSFGIGDNGYDDIPVDMLLWYAAVDADVTRQVCNGQRELAQRRQLTQGKTTPNVTLQKDMENVMKTLYVPGTNTLATMSYRGTKLDFDKLAVYEEEIGELRDKTLGVIREMVCRPLFNPNSSDEMADLVQKVLEINPAAYIFTDGGAISVTDTWLATQQEECTDAFTQEVIYYIRIYKKAAKAISSFLAKFRKLAQYDGRVHTSFNLNGTATGRLSSSNPNLQNVPLWMCRFEPHPKFTRVSSPGWNIKALFIPSNPDRVYFQLDIAAAEIRVLCAYAGDERLTQALIDGQDIHSFIASHIFDHTYEEFVEGKDSDPKLKLLRTATKRVVFGMIYGAGPYKIAEQIYNGLATDEAEKEEQIRFAKSVMDMLFDRFPKIQEYIDSTVREVQAHNQVRTYFGRRRRFDLRKASWKEERACERKAVNFKIQSSASDIVLAQLCAVTEAIEEIGGEVLLTVHDSIAGEIDRDCVPLMRAFFDHHIVDEVLRKFSWLPVPFAYDLEVGPTYGELVAYDVLESREEDVPERVLKKVRPLMARAGLTFFGTTP
jgi:DNA polymerase I-like protein with 3'-5' exonuclease and polymerase domains